MASPDLIRLGLMVSPDLLAELELRYPPDCGGPHDSHVDFIIRAAQRDVVLLLARARKESEQASLTSPLTALTRRW